MANILIPTPLRKFTANQSQVQTEGTTVKDHIHSLTQTHPDLQKHLLDSEGNVRRFVRIYVGDEDVQSLGGIEATIAQESEISIIPAIAGGLG